MPQPLRFNLSPVRVTMAAALVVGLVVAGCGSSDKSSSSSSTPTTAAITKAQFVSKANAICAKGNKLTDAAGASLGNHPTPAQISATVRTRFAPAVQAQITAIRALGAPTGDEATVTKFLDLAQADLDKVKGNPSLLVAQRDAFGDFAKLAHPYGLTECDKAS
jgi:outer membrane murein-binding lipoprotein Lpp